MTSGLSPAVHVFPPLRLVLGRFSHSPHLRPGRTALAGILRRAQAHVFVGHAATAASAVLFALAHVSVMQRRVRYAIRQGLVDDGRRVATFRAAARAWSEH